MKILRLHGPHDLRLHDDKEPVPAPGQQLLKVTSVGICGSDLHWFSEQGIGDARLVSPLVLGHEFSAVIDGGACNGQRVAVDPAISCGVCEPCQKGYPNLCSKVIFAGHGGTDGALREFMTWDITCLHQLPEGLTDEDGAMLEPLGVAIHAVDLAHLKTGMTVGVFGCGPIGLLIIQLARLSGAARIIATDKLPHRVEAAKALGAQHVFLTDGGPSGLTCTCSTGAGRTEPEVSQILAANGKRGVDVAFEVAGEQGAVEDAVAAVVPGGKVILAGIPADDRISLPAGMVRRKGLTLKLVRRMKHTYPRAIDLVSRGLVDVRSLVTHRFPLEQAAEAFAVAERREGLKIIVTVNRGR
jgi:L-iditol 2-dehydrogenase